MINLFDWLQAFQSIVQQQDDADEDECVSPQCGCCDGSSLNWHLPDLTVAYRLHSECGRMINLFDWLQAFQSIVQQQDDADEDECVSPQVQARFTRAVCELEFLGFIKSSKRKVDHVEKLTW
uniref:Origin recognition complex subunit 3 winged helix C-terminal domain-containing protein n=1 Tax=Lutzomyia longipalpis TaxID=7200 RepID=A0A1B0CKL9_LUTLO